MMGSGLRIRALIALLHDGELGFRELSQNIQDAKCRAFMLEEAAVRAVYAAELEREFAGTAGTDVPGNGTSLGTVHRAWTELKAKLGAEDYELLETTQICESFAVKAYRQVLEDTDLPAPVRELAGRQAKHVYRSQEMVKAFRQAMRPG